MDDPATVAALIDMAATGARRLTPGELSRVLTHVAAAGFDPDARERAGGRLAGITWQGHILKGSDLLTPADAHYLRHVAARGEWPRGTTVDIYVGSIREAILDPHCGVLTSLYQGKLQLTMIARSAEWRGPNGFDWILVDYRVVTGHWMTAYQPRERLKALLNPSREDPAMVTETEINSRVETGLYALIAELDWLPNTVAEWDEMSDGEQVSISLDWDHLIADYLTELDEFYRADVMTMNQRERYHILLQKLRDAQPLFEQLNLYRPTVSLDIPSSTAAD